MNVIHDGDGKIYADGEFLFEVMIRDGDEAARRINELIDRPKVTTNMKWLCSVCGLVPVDRCPKCGLNEDELLSKENQKVTLKKCPKCEGTGNVDIGIYGCQINKCTRCKGTGKIKDLK